MLRKFLQSFTASHATIMFVAVLFAPGALALAGAITPVIIQDQAGRQASVTGGKLNVYDQIADYAKDPKNAVDISFFNGANCEGIGSYRPPSGKSLVITASSGYVQQGYSGIPFSGFYLYAGAKCNGRLLTNFTSSVTATNGYGGIAPIAVQYGNGIVLPEGQALSINQNNDIGITIIHGYLVPSSAVAAAGSAEAAWQGPPVTADMVAAKMAGTRGH